MRRQLALLAASGSMMTSGPVLAQLTPSDPLDSSYPTVITPTRLVQALADVPASVTVISADTIERFGIRSIPEALRLVPGMSVVHATGPDYQISYHGTNTLSPRRMNVLVDGISVYRPAFSEVVWSQLPIAIEDVQRIEVTRGPNSASYGPNSMLAVVNIITRNANDIPLATAAAWVDNHGAHDLTARAAVRADGHAVAITASTSSDRGFDSLTQDAHGHDSMRIDRLVVKSSSRVGAQSTLSVQASLAQGVSGVPFVDGFQQTYPDRRFEDIYGGLRWVSPLAPNHEVSLRLDYARQATRQTWRTCVPTVGLLPEMFALWRANPRYASEVIAGRVPTGGSPADDALALAAVSAIRALGPEALAPRCVRPNQDVVQRRLDLELQDTYVASDRLRIVGGVGLREQDGESQTYLGGKVGSSVRWAFANAEIKPVDTLVISAGGYAERNSLAPSTFSPRAAVNVHVQPGQTVRVVYSTGTRSPDIQEQRTNWTYRVDDVVPPLNGSATAVFYQSRVGAGNLKSERIRSFEVGYLLNAQATGLVVDARAFVEHLSDLISERTNLAGLVPTNAGSVRLSGAELQASIRIASGWSGYLNYAYLDNQNPSNILERTQWSRHSGSIGVTGELAAGWRTSLAYAGQSGTGHQQSAYGRTDLLISRALDIESSQWTATLGLQRLDSPLTRYSIGSPVPLESRRSGRLSGHMRLAVTMP